jgi:hypothetical protein
MENLFEHVLKFLRLFERGDGLLTRECSIFDHAFENGVRFSNTLLK